MEPPAAALPAYLPHLYGAASFCQQGTRPEVQLVAPALSLPLNANGTPCFQQQRSSGGRAVNAPALSFSPVLALGTPQGATSPRSPPKAQPYLPGALGMLLERSPAEASWPGSSGSPGSPCEHQPASPPSAVLPLAASIVAQSMAVDEQDEGSTLVSKRAVAVTSPAVPPAALSTNVGLPPALGAALAAANNAKSPGSAPCVHSAKRAHGASGPLGSLHQLPHDVLQRVLVAADLHSQHTQHGQPPQQQQQQQQGEQQQPADENERAKTLLEMCGNADLDVVTCRDVLAAADGDMDRAVTMLFEMLEGNSKPTPAPLAAAPQQANPDYPTDSAPGQWADDYSLYAPDLGAPQSPLGHGPPPCAAAAASPPATPAPSFDPAAYQDPSIDCDAAAEMLMAAGPGLPPGGVSPPHQQQEHDPQPWSSQHEHMQQDQLVDEFGWAEEDQAREALNDVLSELKITFPDFGEDELRTVVAMAGGSFQAAAELLLKHQEEEASTKAIEALQNEELALELQAAEESQQKQHEQQQQADGDSAMAALVSSHEHRFQQAGGSTATGGALGAMARSAAALAALDSQHTALHQAHGQQQEEQEGWRVAPAQEQALAKRLATLLRLFGDEPSSSSGGAGAGGSSGAAAAANGSSANKELVLDVLKACGGDVERARQTLKEYGLTERPQQQQQVPSPSSIPQLPAGAFATAKLPPARAPIALQGPAARPAGLVRSALPGAAAARMQMLRGAVSAEVAAGGSRRPVMLPPSRGPPQPWMQPHQSYEARQSLWEQYMNIPELKQLAEERDALKQGAYAAFQRGEGALARALKEQGEEVHQRLLKLREEQQDKLHKAQNSHISNFINVDLHSLTVDHALIKLAEWIMILEKLPSNKTVNIITGRGKHSEGGEPKLLHAVREYLEEHGYTFVEHIGAFHMYMPAPVAEEGEEQFDAGGAADTHSGEFGGRAAEAGSSGRGSPNHNRSRSPTPPNGF